MPDNPHYECQVTSINSKMRFGVVLLLGFILRAISLDFQGMWRDEVDQWRFALSPMKEMLSHFTVTGWNGPLFSPLLRLWIMVAGDTVYAMRYLSLLCGVLCIPLIYVLCKRLFDQKAAFWSALMIALSPYMVWYAQEVKMYTWVPMLIILALYGLERACKKPLWIWWAITLAATCLAFYSHILAALMIPVLALWFCLTPNRHKKAWVGGGIVFILLTLPYMPLLVWQFPMVITARETGYPAFTLLEMVTALLTGWTSGIYMGAWTGGFISHTITGFICMLALLGLFSGLLSKSYLKLCKLIVWILLPFIAIWFISFMNPLFTDRYLIWSAPAFYILAAVGVTKLTKANRKLMGGIGVVVIVSTFPALYSQSAYPIKPQFNKAAEYVLSHNRADDLLLFQIPYNAQVFNFYSQNQIYNWDEAPYTNWKLADGRYQVGESYVQQEMSKIVDEYNRIWLVYSEVALWDQRELVKNWLDTRWDLVDTQVFQGVTLYSYQNQ